MRKLADLVVRGRVPILILALVGLVVAGAVGGGVADRLSSGGFEDPAAESAIASEFLVDNFGVRSPDLVLVATSTGSIDSPEAIASGMSLTQALAAEKGVTAVSSYWSLGSPPSLRSSSGQRAMIFANLEGDQSAVLERSGVLAEDYRGEYQGLDILVGGPGALFAEVNATVESDLVRAEAIAFPITLVLMVIVFGTVVAALLPLAVGVFAIVGTFLVLDIIARGTEVSIFSLNQATALGLGLAIDYALFVVSRFREELAGGFDPNEAVRRTMRTAGRTVLFSAGTVMASLASMLVFPLAFLRSFGYSGIAVVALAAFGAVIVLPALLAVLGHRVNKLRVRRLRQSPEGTGLWHRLATAVMRRPVPIATLSVALLVFLGAPFFRVELGNADDRVLPPTSAARQVGDVLRAEFDGFESSPIQVVAAGLVKETEIDAYAASLSSLDGVARVDAATGSYVSGVQVLPAGPAYGRFLSGAGTYLNAIPAVDPSSGPAEELVAEVRDLASPVPVGVTGESASLVDIKASLIGDLPLALAIIGVVTFVVLFLMFGSVLVPAKAVVLNLLSLSATFGSMVWIFQEGHLSELLGFTATGTLQITMPILMFAIAFGLSMDYEVFLLSRIKEEHDRNGDTVSSVALGLERTGRIVTAAALLMSVVFGAFATSGVSFMKMFGVGMTVAVLVDAFVVRATLVPAFMRLAGRANWWAPAWMKRIYERFGFSDHVELEPAPSLESV